MMLAQQAEIPQIMGGEASDLTQQGQRIFVPHLVWPAGLDARRSRTTCADGVKAKTVAVVWVNNDFGKGGARQNFIKEMNARGHPRIVADLSTEVPVRPTFAADVVKGQGRQSGSDLSSIPTKKRGARLSCARARKQGIAGAAGRRGPRLLGPEGDRSCG